MTLNTILSTDVIQPWMPAEEPDDDLPEGCLEMYKQMTMNNIAERMMNEPFAKGDWLKRIDEKFFKRREVGPIEEKFSTMFSMMEITESKANPEGATMGMDPHYDARQTYQCMARYVDTNRSRVQIRLESANKLINLDIITFEGKKAWCLKESPNEPIIFVRCTFFPVIMKIPIKDLFCSTDPYYGVQYIKCASREEMDIHLGVFRENALNISSDLKAKVDACVDKGLLDIPTSFTTFFTLLLPDEEPMPPKLCRVCGSEGVKTCSKCKVAKYCGKECQTQDWKAGHRRECRPPEKVAGRREVENGREMWVDIDPRAEVPLPPGTEPGMVVTKFPSKSLKEPLHRWMARATKAMSRLGHEGEMLDGLKRDIIMMVKVQISPGSTPKQRKDISIYPQGKTFELDAVPENMGRGFEDYARLHDLIKAEGTDSGIGKGGCKAFLDAYITSEGKLRVMLKVKPLQSW